MMTFHQGRALGQSSQYSEKSLPKTGYDHTVYMATEIESQNGDWRVIRLGYQGDHTPQLLWSLENGGAERKGERDR